ncbi:MAG TPA: hypothetical protein VJ647_03035, partial [Chitinophagaceae bacterium]|nr:hypothetical protein [Chitinophagaceae bacterium]
MQAAFPLNIQNYIILSRWLSPKKFVLFVMAFKPFPKCCFDNLLCIINSFFNNDLKNNTSRKQAGGIDRLFPLYRYLAYGCSD